MPDILVMADSTCDLPAEWVRQYDIRIVPTYVLFGAENLADDGIELTRADFYWRLVQSTVLPTTSAPPLGRTIEIMAQALKDADHVIALTAPANLSAIYNVFRLAAEQLAPERVTLIDSRMLSMGSGWQALIAAEMAEAGASVDEIEAHLLSIQPHTVVWAALDTLEYVRRSGRVGWAAAMVGSFLRIKPIINVSDGEVGFVTRVRTAQRAFDMLVKLTREAAPLERLAVMHTRNLERAKQLADALLDIRPAGGFTIVEATPVLGVHVGPNGLGIGVVCKR